MICDQANKLRRLASDDGLRRASAAGARPWMVAVTSGKGGAGTTSIAVNLAVAAAEAGRRSVMVDADSHGGDAAVMFGLRERYTLADVLAGRRTVEQSLQAAAGSVDVLPGTWGVQQREVPSGADRRLLGQLIELGHRADVVVVDAGSGPGCLLRRLPRVADSIVMVTTAETTSIIDTFAAIRFLAESGAVGPIHTLVNRSPSAAVGRDVQARLRRTCRRLLGAEIRAAGQVPFDQSVSTAVEAGIPLMVAAPGSQAAREVRSLAEKIFPRSKAAGSQRAQNSGLPRK